MSELETDDPHLPRTDFTLNLTSSPSATLLPTMSAQHTVATLRELVTKLADQSVGSCTGDGCLEGPLQDLVAETHKALAGVIEGVEMLGWLVDQLKGQLVDKERLVKVYKKGKWSLWDLLTGGLELPIGRDLHANWRLLKCQLAHVFCQ